MKNKIFFYFLCVFLSYFGYTQQEIYVSTSGSDINAGTKEKPVATLNAARDLIRNYKAAYEYPDKGFVVWVSGGEYQQLESFALNEMDSGIPGVPVVYRAVEGEKVFLTGGTSINTNQFKAIKSKSIRQRLTPKAAKNVRVVDLKALGINDFGTHKQFGHALSVYPAPIELFFNEEPMTLARYPNEGFIQIEKVIDPGSNPRIGDYSDKGGIIEYKDERHSVWAGDDDIWFQGTFSNGYADDKLHVEWINPKKKQLKFTKPHMYALRGGKPYTHYVAMNILDELDMPGEWYVDRKSGMLYFWPTSDLKKGSIKVSILEDPVVSLEGVSHLVFRDFIVENGRGIGIYMERGSNNLVAGCTVRNFGTTGIFMGQGAKQTVPYITHDHYEGVPVSRRVGNYAGHIYKYTTWDRQAGKNHKILSCDVYNVGAGGIMLSGGSKRHLTPGNNIVENCKVHDYNRRNKFRWGGIIVDGCANKVRHNEIYNSDFQAIFTVGPEHIFEFNNVHDVVKHSDDVSVWYTGRDPSDRGLIVRYNYFHDCGNKKRMNMGIYCDDSSTGITVFGNVFYNMHLGHGVLYSNTGWDLTMKNNIIVNPMRSTVVLSPHYFTWYKGNAHLMFGKGKLFEQRLFKDINIHQPPYSDKYPEISDYMNVRGDDEWEGMYPRNNVLSTNVIVGGHANPIAIYNPKGGNQGVFKNVNNYQLAKGEDPGFVDFENENFMLLENSEVYKKLPDFKPVPFNKMGLYVDEYRKSID